MADLMSKGMRYANQVFVTDFLEIILFLSSANVIHFTLDFQALLSGCSAGGVATVLHCDEFRAMFRGTTRVKCLSDAGLFLDV